MSYKFESGVSEERVSGRCIRRVRSLQSVLLPRISRLPIRVQSPDDRLHYTYLSSFKYHRGPQSTVTRFRRRCPNGGTKFLGAIRCGLAVVDGRRRAADVMLVVVAVVSEEAGLKFQVGRWCVIVVVEVEPERIALRGRTRFCTQVSFVLRNRRITFVDSPCASSHLYLTLSPLLAWCRPFEVDVYAHQYWQAPIPLEER